MNWCVYGSQWRYSRQWGIGIIVGAFPKFPGIPGFPRFPRFPDSPDSPDSLHFLDFPESTNSSGSPDRINKWSCEQYLQPFPRYVHYRKQCMKVTIRYEHCLKLGNACERKAFFFGSQNVICREHAMQNILYNIVREKKTSKGHPESNTCTSNESSRKIQQGIHPSIERRVLQVFMVCSNTRDRSRGRRI